MKTLRNFNADLVKTQDTLDDEYEYKIYPGCCMK